MRVARRLRASPYAMAVIAALCATISACDEDGVRAAPDLHRLATDVHVTIAEHDLVLPFVALKDYARRGASFSLDPERDRLQDLRAADKLLREAARPARPKRFTALAIIVGAYGLNDFDTRQSALCPLLTREWSRSVCDNPWAAIRQALPVNRFTLVDLRDGQDALNCIDADRPPTPVPSMPGQTAILCRARVASSATNAFHRAGVRISGELGAVWTVWGHGRFPETTEAMAQREGEAIVAFVRNALGGIEDFAALSSVMCRLRRPGSTDKPPRAECPKE